MNIEISSSIVLWKIYVTYHYVHTTNKYYHSTCTFVKRIGLMQVIRINLLSYIGKSPRYESVVI